jgi:hypothetical protein
MGSCNGFRGVGIHPVHDMRGGYKAGNPDFPESFDQAQGLLNIFGPIVNPWQDMVMYVHQATQVIYKESFFLEKFDHFRSSLCLQK